MEDYLSEREQIESLRGFVKENAPWAIAGAVIGIGLLIGWQQYQAWQQRQANSASEKYNQTLIALSKGDKTGADRLAAQVKADYSRTAYADLAALAMTRYDVETNDLADAARRLEDVMVGSHDKDMRVVARLRLARVQRAEGKPDLALATLAAVAPEDSTAAFAEVRGDVLSDKGDRAGALAAWREALKSTIPGLVNRELIELKIAALGESPSAPAAVAATAGAKP